jgi:Tol biopolymer transport system component
MSSSTCLSALSHLASGLALASLAACGSTALSTSTHAAYRAEPSVLPISTGEIAPGPWELFAWDPSAEETLRIASHLARDGDAAFSPDGQWLVFSSERGGDLDLWATRYSPYALPAPLVKLTPSTNRQSDPCFSPDGRTLAFVEVRDGDADVFVMPFRPTHPVSAFAQARNLTNAPGADCAPAFSPDGRTIAFASDRDAEQALSELGAASPAAVSSLACRSEIYAMDADGREPRRLTHAQGRDGSPTWSKDGGWIYFDSERDGSSRIWSMRKDGSEATAISPRGALARSPAVMVDGRVAYASSDAAGVLQDLWRIGSSWDDGTEPRWETPLGLDCRAPVFQMKTGRLVCFGRTVDPAYSGGRAREEADALVSAVQ